ncbi:MAG: hypothetical protein R3A45_04025 [Bdellovibrionota bacterium]
MKRMFASVFSVLSISLINIGYAQVEIRIVDVGAGHAAVVKGPDDFYMVYDTGTWTNRVDCDEKLCNISY